MEFKAPVSAESKMIKLTDAEFRRLVDFVYHRYGIDLGKKRQLIEARLYNTLRVKNLSSFSDYFKLLFNDPSGEEIHQFLNKITTNYSYFARENDHFDFLMKRALPYLEPRRKNDLRIWSAGCSSGQEPYNIAMTMDQYFGPKKGMWDTTILATDISTNVLNKAKEGVYSADNLKDLPPTWRNRYFTKLPGGNMKVSDSIRKEVVFRIFNLMDPFVYKKPFDIIFCRNVMIYFDAKTTQALIQKFYDATAEGGFLFIGHSESIDKSSSRFRQVGAAVFQKITR